MAFDYAERGEFARALALVGAEPDCQEGSWQPWAFFKLVMYQTVASLAINPCDPAYAARQFLPFVVAQAALGRCDFVRKLLKDAPWHCLPDSLRIAIARNISAYMPKEACILIEDVVSKTPPMVFLSSLLRAGDRERARSFLYATLEDGVSNIDPRLHLYKIIMEPMLPDQQLDCLNRVYAANRLPALALRDDTAPPSPCNVYVPDPYEFIDGPLVSVLMTTFNVAGRVSAAIESILRQSYRQLELIVVDDCSDDDTVEEVLKWSEADSRVRLLRLERNVGTYCAKSVGLQHADGEFVTCMDADDWSHPLKLAMQINPLLEDDSLIATTSNCLRMFDTGVVDAQPSVHLEHLNYSSLLFRRERVLSDIGGWDACARTAADTEFLWRMNLSYGHGAVENIPGLLSLVSRRDDSLTMANDGTGFVDNVFPPEILKYIEAFNRWHIEVLKSGSLPKVSEDLTCWARNHPFRFSSNVFTDAEDVVSALDRVW